MIIVVKNSCHHSMCNIKLDHRATFHNFHWAADSPGGQNHPCLGIPPKNLNAVLPLRGTPFQAVLVTFTFLISIHDGREEGRCGIESTVCLVRAMILVAGKIWTHTSPLWVDGKMENMPYLAQPELANNHRSNAYLYMIFIYSVVRIRYTIVS